MKRCFTRIISVGLLLMLCTGIAGCSKQVDSSSEVKKEKLKVFFQDNKAPDDDMVSEAVSKLVRERVGMDVEFVMFDAGSYSTKLPMMIATNEPMDICWTNLDNFAERVSKGAYADLTELLKTTPELYNLFEKDFWKGVSVKGKIYAIPTQKEMAEQWACYVETKFLNNMGVKIDPNKIYSLKDMEPILAELTKDGTRPGFMLNTSAVHNHMYELNYFDVIEGDLVLSKDTQKVENYYMTKEFEDYSNLMRNWFNKKYIASDVATRKNYDEYDSEHKGMHFVSYSPYNEILIQNYNDGVQFTPIMMTPGVISNSSTCGSTFAILEKSKHKEAAIKFLEVWNTDSKVKDTITYGIEGVHYNLVDGKIKQVSGVFDRYINQNWASGNNLISTLLVGEPDDKWKKFDEFNKKAMISNAFGFFPDTKDINDKILACKGVASEYTGLLSCGAIDPAEYLPKLKASLKSAGVDAVTAEIQKQYDEWKKSN